MGKAFTIDSDKVQTLLVKFAMGNDMSESNNHDHTN